MRKASIQVLLFIISLNAFSQPDLGIDTANNIVKKYFKEYLPDSIVQKYLVPDKKMFFKPGPFDSNYSLIYDCVYKNDTILSVHLVLTKDLNIVNLQDVENSMSILNDWTNEFKGRFKFSYDSVKHYMNLHPVKSRSTYQILLAFDFLPKIEIRENNFFRQIKYYWVAIEYSDRKRTRSGVQYVNELRSTHFSVETGETKVY